MSEKINSAGKFGQLLSEMNFDIHKVTWGYQDIFYKIIKKLYESGFLSLGDKNSTTKTFFSILNHANKSTFDSVIKSYLEALNSSARWLMRIPQLFEKWSQTGIMLAEKRYFLGIKFFEASKEENLGNTPEDIEFVISTILMINEKSLDMADAFITGFPKLRKKLNYKQIRAFMQDSFDIFRHNPEAARKYLAVDLDSAQKRMDSLTTHVRISDEMERLERFLRGLLGRKLSVDNLSQLDSDDIIERGTSFVAFYKAMYLPEFFAEYNTYSENIQTVKTLLAIGAASDMANSFSIIHGSDGFNTCMSIFPDKKYLTLASAIFYLTELKRSLNFAKDKFTGIRQKINRLIHEHFSHIPPRSYTDYLAEHLSGEKVEIKFNNEDKELIAEIEKIAESSSSWQDTAAYIIDNIKSLQKKADDILPNRLNLPGPLTFFPDFLFPLSVMSQPDGKTMSDMRDAEKLKPEDDDGKNRNSEDKRKDLNSEKSSNNSEETEEEGNPANLVGYFYDEWDNRAGDYYPDWCCVNEIQPEIISAEVDISSELQGYSARVRQIFEQIKPEEIREESRVLEGDEIHLDHFMEYISQGPKKQNTDMRFYNKPVTQKRDVVISLLLDFSGSTGNTVEQHLKAAKSAPNSDEVKISFHNAPRLKNDKTVLDIEKESAFVLASGLKALGDKFSIYGFTGNGRENCLFFRIKDIDEEWDDVPLQRLLNVNPGASTRMGPAIRHAGWKLEHVPAKTKLLLLITDGQPRDQGYDSSNLYAQHDVRKAAAENMQKNIHTFCISAGENSPADMEIMFPNGRHQILDNIEKLPQTLSQLYLKLTK